MRLGRDRAETFWNLPVVCEWNHGHFQRKNSQQNLHMHLCHISEIFVSIIRYVADCGLLFIKKLPRYQYQSHMRLKYSTMVVHMFLRFLVTCSRHNILCTVIPSAKIFVTNRYFLFVLHLIRAVRRIFGEDHWHIHGHSFSIEQTFNLVSNVDKDTDTVTDNTK